MEQIEKKLKEILSKYLPDKSTLDSFDPEMKLISDLKINSARIVDIILDIEEEFQIDFSNRDIEKISNISGILNLIKTKTQEK